MQFHPKLKKGKLIRRYKRFLADIVLDNGDVVIAHCTNSGSMRSCLEEGAEVWLTPVDDPKRKTKFTWEMIRIGEGWVGINTSNPNALAFEWIREGLIPGLGGFRELRREVKWEDSRFDIYGEGEEGACFVEVKNVSLKEGNYALFPDAVTTRGRKHLHTLMRVKENGMRAVMLYVVQRMDVQVFAPAREIDPNYAASLVEAMANGVEVIAVQARVSPEGIGYAGLLPVEISPSH